MYKQWKKDVERVKQATKLPISLLNCEERAWAQMRSRCEAAGEEIVCWAKESGRVCYVMIKKDEWPSSARALLTLFFESPSPDVSLQDEAVSWLQSVLSGRFAPIPAKLEEEWTWKEARAVFLFQRLNTEHPCELPVWQHLLQSFLSEKIKISLYSLSPTYLLLMLPVSVLTESGKAEEDLQSFWLEWASGLQDLIMTETLEDVRVIVTTPVERVSALADALRAAADQVSLLERYYPRLLVSATWQFPLERWALSLSSDVRQTLERSFPAVVREISLSAEQIATLEIFFAHHLNISETARALFVHRNTLLYRLDKIAEQTGLDPRHLENAVLLRLALLFR